MPFRLGANRIGRLVVGEEFDADAKAYINAVSATGADAIAIDTLVKSLKADSIWDKLQLAYPFYGTAYSTAKYNLVDPQDTDAAFRFTEVTSGGAISYTSNGAETANSSFSYLDTKFSLDEDVAFNDTHISFWETNTSNWTGTTIPYGTFDEGAGEGIFATPLISGGGRARVRMYVNAADELTNTGDGFWLGQNDGTTTELYRNGGVEATVAETNSGVTLPGGFTVKIGALQVTTGNYNYGAPTHTKWFSMGNEMTSTEVDNYYDHVNTFLTAIGR